MSSFKSSPVLVPHEDGVHWELKEPFEYHLGIKDSGWVISIPVGFVTDFASVPKLLHWLIGPWGKHGRAAVLHDYLYRFAVFDRVVCDAIFLEAMRIIGCSKSTRRVIYAAVRVWGRYAWKKHRRHRDPGDKRKVGK